MEYFNPNSSTNNKQIKYKEGKEENTCNVCHNFTDYLL